MSAANTRRPCPQCAASGKERRNDQALAHYADGVHCFRCGFRQLHDRACVSCGTTFTPIAKSHDRCEACFRGADKQHDPVTPKVEERAKLAAIWSLTLELPGTIGEAYIRYRKGVMPPPDSALRFLPANDRFPPSLCALITSALTNEPQSLHFTRLRADGLGKAGTDRDKTLLKGHPKSGGVIKLWPNEAVTHGLAIAEGIESALAAAHLFTPVWSTVDAGNMKKFPVLDGIESLTIFADNDLAGLDAARACGRRWRDAGREVRVLRSRTLGHDVADEVAA